MKEEDYYPAGAYSDPNAPYNQKEVEPIDVDVSVIYVINKLDTIKTTDYIAESWEDVETDDEGYIIKSGGIDYDFSNCNFIKDYENQRNSIPKLLNMLENYLKKELLDINPNSPRGYELQKALQSCQGWKFEDIDIIKKN